MANSTLVSRLLGKGVKKWISRRWTLPLGKSDAVAAGASAGPTRAQNTGVVNGVVTGATETKVKWY
jgi:hypothetical protein